MSEPDVPVDAILEALEALDTRLVAVESQLDEGKAAVDPETLPAWVDWLTSSYELEEKVPSDWELVPGAHQELAALRAAWVAAYKDDGTPVAGFGPVQWHDALPRVLERIATWVADHDTRKGRYAR